MSEKEVKVDKSLLDDGSYLEEEPKNNKVLFIVLGLVVTALAVAGGVMMFSGGEEATVVDQSTTPSLTLTENQTQTEELVPIEVTIETEPEPEPKPETEVELEEVFVDVEEAEQILLEGEVESLVAQMDRESETQAEKREELMLQAGYAIDEETQVITAPNGNTIETDGTVTSAEGVVLSDNSMETNADGSYTVVHQGTTYTVTQAQLNESYLEGFGYLPVDGIPAGVFSDIANVGFSSGSDPNQTTEEFAARWEDDSLRSDVVLKFD